MWNNTDIPLAFLITFRSYGTWLHGDERGSVNRFRNQYKSRRLPPEKKWIETNTQRLKGEIVTLNAAQRACARSSRPRNLRRSTLEFACHQCADQSRSRGRFNWREETGSGAECVQSKRHAENARKRLLAK